MLGWVFLSPMRDGNSPQWNPAETLFQRFSQSYEGWKRDLGKSKELEALGFSQSYEGWKQVRPFGSGSEEPGFFSVL